VSKRYDARDIEMARMVNDSMAGTGHENQTMTKFEDKK
jgi:hypothetical protein